MARKYVILEASDLVSLNIDFSQVCETSANTLRWNNDQSQTFVKYDGHKPGFLYGKPTLTNSEILSILNDPANGWCSEEPEN
jgi:hypothetical protein